MAIPDVEEANLTALKGEEEHVSLRTSASVNGISHHYLSSISSALLIIAALLCTVTNFWVLYRFVEVDVELDRFTPLPRPNKFIGLADIDRSAVNTTQLGPIVTWPTLLKQISSVNTTYVYPDDLARFFTSFGTISPNDRRFRVNQEIHTIAQFRTRDFGLEDCQIIINVPYREPPVKILGLMNYTVELSSDTVHVEMWRLSSARNSFTNPSALSWSSRPQRMDASPLHTFAIERGRSSQSVHFPCPQDSTHTFEFSCIGHGCSIDFWQNGFQDELGIFARQYVTI